MYIITAQATDGKQKRWERTDHKAAILMLGYAKKRYRNAQMYQEFEVWIQRRRACEACIAVTIYEHSIVATAEADKITRAMMKKALRREFPKHTFYNNDDGGDGYLRVDADRWMGDRANRAQRDGGGSEIEE